jgi:hypothetical protein
MAFETHGILITQLSSVIRDYSYGGSQIEATRKITSFPSEVARYGLSG